MSGRVQHLDDGIAELEHVAVSELLKTENDLCRFMERVCGADAIGQKASARNVVGVNVGVDRVRDLQPLALGKGNVGLDVALLGVDNGALTDRSAAEEVGRAAGLVIVVWPEDHRM